jgi:GNAT superfamily N-acetyltransferase
MGQHAADTSERFSSETDESETRRRATSQDASSAAYSTSPRVDQDVRVRVRGDSEVTLSDELSDLRPGHPARLEETDPPVSEVVRGEDGDARRLTCLLDRRRSPRFPASSIARVTRGQGLLLVAASDASAARSRQHKTEPTEMALEFPTRAERPGKLPHADSLAAPEPAFMYHESVVKRLFGRVVAEYAEFLFYAWDDEREEVIGVGHAIPAAWDGDTASLPDGGFDAVIEARFAQEPLTPTVLCALGIQIAPECRGQGLSRRMIERMAEIGRAHGLDTLIAPVRPTRKHRYPLTPIERYLSWRRPDGTHLDPWLRTHERLGADIVKVAPESVVVTASVAEWEEWTEMALPESGAYVVSGALVPIEIDRERDEGVYVEPNVWMVHSPRPPNP